MKSSSVFLIAACFLVIGGVSIAFKQNLFNKQANGHVLTDSEKGFAVVELFTSEGCSSCPPADNLLANTQKEVKNKPVYILAYHVDYWDRLGWKDSFSDAAFTERQKVYADLLHLNSIYTPQVVVNGRNEFVGSNKNALDNAINSALRDSLAPQLLIIGGISNGILQLHYEAKGSFNKADLVLNLVQKFGQTMVKGGENSGRKLTHVQIVRRQIIESLQSKSGTVNFDLPAGYRNNEWELIGFIQNKSDGAILCASRLPLKQ